LTYVCLIIREAIRAIFARFGSFIGSTLTVYLAMLTAGSFAVITSNISVMLDRFKSEASLEIYLRNDIDSLAGENLQDALAANEYILQLDYIDKDMALFRLRETFGEEMVAGLKTNPLPASYEITLEPSVYESDNFERLVDSLAGLPGVEDIGYAPSAIAKVKALFKISTYLGLAIGILVILATGFIVGNTIHVKIADRRQTFYIMRLVGAGAAFIQTPYLIVGGLIGISGGALAVLTLKIGALYFSYRVAPINFLNSTEVVCFIITGCLVALAGSSIALKKFLDI
jgi:cell division transport system permease protein